jgi:CheY-like chemotaxis protein
MTLDLVLPDADGLALLAELRSGTRPIPKTVVVSRVRSADRDTIDMRALGIVGWLDKPIDSTKLVDAVRSAVNGHERRPRVLQVRDVPAGADEVERLLGRPADVSNVGSMQEAQRRLQSQEFDLVLVDVAARNGRVMLALSPAALERDGDIGGMLARMSHENGTEYARR